jgi:branched-chain amino acid transport system permease protein
MGSFAGAVCGSFLVGLVQAFSARYFDAEFAAVTVFVVLAIFLLLRPSGLLGKRAVRAI